MKKFIAIHVAAVFLLSSLAQAEWREFTSADGSKKVKAEVLGYDEASGTATLQLEGNRRITSPVSAFTEDGRILSTVERFIPEPQS